jgi:hypothetical protein
VKRITGQSEGKQNSLTEMYEGIDFIIQQLPFSVFILLSVVILGRG